MDTCTLIVMTFITTQGCMLLEKCDVKNGIKYCLPMRVTSCPIPRSVYACERPDGTKYNRYADTLEVVEEK